MNLGSHPGENLPGFDIGEEGFHPVQQLDEIIPEVTVSGIGFSEARLAITSTSSSSLDAHRR